MTLPVRPPLPPMLARLVRELPRGDYLYEPKWDGFRALVFRDGVEVDVRSRNNRPLARYFPELVRALADVPLERYVLDGEIVVTGERGYDFAALMARLHPTASRVERLSREMPAELISFDLVAAGDEDLRALPFAARRRRLEEVVGAVPAPLAITPITDDAIEAERWFGGLPGGGVDGVVAKHRDLEYVSGKRVMLKVKAERTADCVVAGFRWLADRPMLGSLLLGLYDDEGVLRHVGVVTSFTAERRAAVLDEVAPFIAGIEGHSWEHGFGLARSPVGRLLGAAGRWSPAEMTMDWVPLRPELACEVAYDQLDQGRFRHAARFRRWRPDREPYSCTFAQLTAPALPIPEAP